MTDIVAWPSFRNQITAFTVSRPVRKGLSMFSQKRYASSAGPARRLAQVTVSSLAGERDGAGLVQALNAVIDGGVELVRMDAPPANWWRDVPPAPYSLTGPAMAGTVTTLGGYDAIALTGQVPGALVCRAYDVIGSYTAGTLTGTARAVTTVRAALDGTATIPLFSALSAGTIRIGAPESVVWSVDDIPQQPQPLQSDWSYTWSLTEVLTGEIPVGSTEVDPW